jgi:hypothetical protein
LEGDVNIEYASNVNKVIVTLAQVLSGVGALLILTENDVLGISDTVAAWIVFGSNVLTIASTALRANWLPVVTSGVGLEAPATPSP